MRSWFAVGARVAIVALGWICWTGAAAPARGSDVTENVRLLDVPYVPQSGELCGGAALAMVLRYWGESGVLAEDFAALLETGAGGIRAQDLVGAVVTRGWTGFLLPGKADVVDQLLQGRPVIGLLQVDADTYHYVVLVGWVNGWVVLHDPNLRPFLAVREEKFESDWSGSNGWALLVLPPAPDATTSASERAADVVPATPIARDECSSLVEEGIRLSAQGDSTGAELEFLAARALCPASAAPLRELAGLRFRAGDWEGASRLARSALTLDANDRHAWRLLAGSRYLADDLEGALGAWNHLSEPRNDLTRIGGLSRTRYSTVAGQLELPPGVLLTPQAFRRARRRLAELPTQEGFRLGLRPLPNGVAQVDVAVVERPLVGAGPWDIARAGGRALIEHELGVDIASPTGNGELWTAKWRWWEQRPRVSLSLAAPTAGGRPGVWFVNGFWERQSYVAIARSTAGRASTGELNREERRRTALSFADWFGPALRFELGAALDRWDEWGSHLALNGSIETRWLRDRLAVSVSSERWMSLDDGPPFASGAALVELCPDGLSRCERWHGRVGFSRAGADAPLALWSGAGTGFGRAPLLRAHPLLDGGIVRGKVFGRSLAHATIERQSWPWLRGPLRFGGALFVDAAKAWDSGPTGQLPSQVDGGIGFLMRCLGMKGMFRVDVAHGFTDGNLAVSIAWRNP